MHRLGVALLGAPVIALVYLQAAFRRSLAIRFTLLAAIAALVAGSTLAIGAPSETSARPPLVAASLPPTAFTTTLRTGVGLRDEVTVSFTSPMDTASVAASLTLTPSADVRLSWRDDGRTLAVRPATRWSSGTFYNLSVARAARSRDGQALSSPARAPFVTRGASRISIESADPPGSGTALRPEVVVRSEAAVDPSALLAALRSSPAAAWDLASPVAAGESATEFRLVPAGALAAGATYRLSIAAGLADVDGARVQAPAPFALRTPDAPSVVRFRPAAGAEDVARDAAVSVRFTERMNRATTTRAFSAIADGKRVAFESTRWAEGGTVLVATLADKLAAGAKVTLTVDATATSARGIVLAQATSAEFTVAKPAHRTATKPSSKPAAKPSPPPSGGSAGSATWYAVEKYYLRLMNCTRTGGWVTSSGSCSSPGGRNVAPLSLSAGISSKVSRPYAKYLARHNQCDHFIGGTPGDRLRRAGYTSYKWGENLGCRSGNPYDAVLGSHLYFQSEKSYGGGHYVNLMNSLYDRAGIGVWVSSGRVRLVVDFYHP